MTLHSLHMVLTGLRTSGVVVANEEHCDGHGCAYYPVVRYALRGGQTSLMRGAIGTDNPPEFHVGEAVPVYYDPRHPQTALIASWRSLWLGPLGFFLLPEGFALAMAWPLLRQLRARGMRADGADARHRASP